MFHDKGKEIVFVRHGQSVYNLEYRFYGWSDPELTDLGREQAEEAAKKIRDFINPDRIICSDLKRAYDTALPIAKVFDLEPIKFEGLREIRNGDWEATRVDDVKKQYPELFKQFLVEQKEFTFPNGENYFDVYKRAKKVFDEQLELSNSMILVAHYGVIDALLSGIFFGNPVSKNGFLARNAKIIKFDIVNGQAILQYFNA